MRPEPYTFQQCTSSFKFFNLNKQCVQDSLSKWSMKDGIKVQAYSFNRPYKVYFRKEFVKDFLADQTVISTLLKNTSPNHWIPIGIPAEKVVLSSIPCVQLTMSMFDRLSQDSKFVRGLSGDIVKCAPKYVNVKGGCMFSPFEEEVEISDRLRQLILNPFVTHDSGPGLDEDMLLENSITSLFSSDERNEFLFRLFSHVVIGGSLCQYEDSIQPYLDTVQALYKDIVTVKMNKDQEDKMVQTLSGEVVMIHSASNSACGDTDLLFNTGRFNNFLYLFISPEDRIVKTLYHCVV